VVLFHPALLTPVLIEADDVNARVTLFEFDIFLLRRRQAVVRVAHRWPAPSIAEA
jgi:hypothetical protein